MSAEVLGGPASWPEWNGRKPDQHINNDDTWRANTENPHLRNMNIPRKLGGIGVASEEIDGVRFDFVDRYLNAARSQVEEAFGVAAANPHGEVYATAALAPDIFPVEVNKPFTDTTTLVAERCGEAKFTVRNATEEDIPTLVDIDLRSFKGVYQGYEGGVELQREDLTKKFMNRFDLLGGEWMPVVTQKDEIGEDEIVGFMVSCPTNKKPSEFVSWEETTDDGSLNSLYDPNGKYAYVVTLSMDPSVRGQRGQNSLFLDQIAKIVKHGIDTAFFESRMPGLRKWVDSKAQERHFDVDSLNESQKMSLAQEYFGLTRERKGKAVPYDPLLKVYAGVGCNFLSVMPDAYQDDESMNFGVLCTYEPPLPQFVKRSPALRRVVSGAIGLAGKSSWLSRKLFG